MAQVAVSPSMSPQIAGQAQPCASLLASLEAELALTAAHAFAPTSPLPPSPLAPITAPQAPAAQGSIDPFPPSADKGPIGPFASSAEKGPIGPSQTPESVLSPPISASASEESSAGSDVASDGPEEVSDVTADADVTTEQALLGPELSTGEGDVTTGQGSGSPGRGEAAPVCACAVSKTEAEYGFGASAVACGAPGTQGFRLYFRSQAGTQAGTQAGIQAGTQAGSLVSPWHTVPLFAERGLLHMVCEIPRNTRAKFEVSTSEFGNPIKQDTKKGKLRFYGMDMEWNYGMFPQTWEDPSHASKDCGGFVGDNDPVDVVEIGDHSPRTGEVYAVKPVAALAMIDEGELDWKVVAISAGDPRCALVHDVEDLEAHFPGQLAAIREWFRTYKTHEGKGLNKFELNEEFVGRRYTLDVIAQTHAFWKGLVQRAKGGKGGVAVGDVPLITGCFGSSHEVASAVTSEACEGEKVWREHEGETYGGRGTAMLGA